jgi:chitin disaccharide deacetylase
MKRTSKQWTLVFVLACLCWLITNAQADLTYAEKLGFPKGSRVVILHVDDAGMSFDSNEGAIEAMEKSVASSTSVMMPCPWVPGFVGYLKTHPNTDAGLHLTLTSEWKNYRWGPVAGKPAVPGLVDSQGALWASPEEVVMHGSADEVETEIRAQIQKALRMGFTPTHLDSHMGTLFASPAFTERYIKVGIEYKIPVMFPGGHNTLIRQQMNLTDAQIQMTTATGQMIWMAGLPVLDDLHNTSYDWILPKGMAPTQENWRKYKLEQYMATFKLLRPGLTMVIMHCTEPSDVFAHITDSGPAREADLYVMLSPAFKEFLQDEGIIITTWREIKARRDKVVH